MLNKSPMIRIAPVGELNAIDREPTSPFMWTVAYRMKRKVAAPALTVAQQTTITGTAGNQGRAHVFLETEEEVLS